MKAALGFVLVAMFVSVAVNGQNDGIVKATTQTLTSLDTTIRQLLRDNPQFIGGFVRLSFHDCVGDRCDGCINFDHHDNKGKKTTILISYFLVHHSYTVDSKHTFKSLLSL